MADTKLSALPAGSAIADADLFYADQSATSVSITGAQIASKAPVQTVAGRTGAVTLSFTDVSGVATNAQGGVGKVTLTQPATGSTLTVVDGKTLTSNNTLALSGTDSTTMTFPATSDTVAGLGAAQTFSAANTFSAAGASAVPGLKVTGVPTTGLGTTNTKPQFLIEPAGTSSNAWSNSGTMLGVNAASGWGGSLSSWQIAAAQQASITATGGFTVAGGGSVAVNGGGNVSISSGQLFFGASSISNPTTAQFQLGGPNAASPVSQKLSSQGTRAGTDSNGIGGNLTIQSGTGTGTGTPSTLLLQSPVSNGGGATLAQVQTTGMTINVGTAVLTNYTVANLPAAATAGAGATAFVTDASNSFIVGLGLTVVGGGANKVPVYSDGTNWIIG